MFKEEEVFEIDLTGGAGGEESAASGSIDIDWSQIDTTTGATSANDNNQWEIIQKDAVDTHA